MPNIIDAMPRGIDVSNWQGAIDWDAVAASGVAFAFLKASEGVTFRDPTLPRNWPAVRRVGMGRGAYHFARPNLNAAVAEARHFMDTVEAQGVAPGDLLALDLEEESGSLSRAENVPGWALAWLREVEQIAGYPPLLYASPSVIAEYGLSDPAFARYLLWLASWGSQFPACPAPWSALPIGILLWQYADNVRVPGISGAVDGDRFVLPIDQLARFGKPADVAVPAEPPAPSSETMTVDAAAWGRLVSYAGYMTGDVSKRVAALAGKNKADRAERDAIVAEMVRAGSEALS